MAERAPEKFELRGLEHRFARVFGEATDEAANPAEILNDEKRESDPEHRGDKVGDAAGQESNHLDGEPKEKRKAENLFSESLKNIESGQRSILREDEFVAA